MSAPLRFWSYVPEDGFERHGTKDEAVARAYSALREATAAAYSDGWPEFVEGICWGRVSEAVVETERRDKAEELAACLDDNERDETRQEFGEWDEIVNYAMRAVS